MLLQYLASTANEQTANAAMLQLLLNEHENIWGPLVKQYADVQAVIAISSVCRLSQARTSQATGRDISRDFYA